jgi:uncharacterized protein YeaO (DUF488 family)
MLKTKCILLPREDDDGKRFSIMSRHTLNDGVTPDLRITSDSFDFWLKIFSPPASLVGDYYKRGLSWENYEARFYEYLRSSRISPSVDNFVKYCLNRNVTVMCIEKILFTVIEDLLL